MILEPLREDVVTTADGRTLGFAEYGDPMGAPVFWFHGTPGARRQLPPETAVEAQARGLRVIGVDREPAMLDEARKRVPEADLRCGRLDDLPIEEDELDAALLVLVLHHVEDLSGVFSELARVLRGGGRAIVLDMVEHDRAEFRRTMGHKHLGLSASGLGALAAGHGLEMVGQCELARAEGALGPALQLLVFEKKG